MRRRSSRIRFAAAIAAGTLVATGCSSSHHEATITVRPIAAGLTRPMSVRISGLSAGQVFKVAISSVDAQHTHWGSSARFRANAAGVIDVDRARSLGGSYTGVHPMGLMEALSPIPVVTDSRVYPGAGRQTFDLRVTAAHGQTVGQATFHRQPGRGVRTSPQTVAHQGFAGVYHQAAQSARRRPAILAFGGSEGGNAMGPVGEGFAAAGYSTLTVAYFHAPGLPRNLVKIPLEYFARALRWLRQQPGVDPHRIYVFGVSRGSEAAQLVAVHYPRLLYGVILGVPSNVANTGLTGGVGGSAQKKDVSAWTFHGRQVPYSYVPGSDAATEGDSVIPVERIQGPMFLTCAGADSVWPSCPMSHAIIARLRAHHDPYQHVLAAYPDAGHGVGQLVPYEPTAWTPSSWRAGRDRLGTQIGLADVWPKVLHFLGVTARR